ncbi:IclR family transcriptional regulator [Bradyrhizobium sp. U87765 SZCCT0131]|uniref:IclR family transcriptional regulator n=1 Tax=unclassified Bradyrhizobium TaxID=2631580 RepID=UPI001BAD6663|nr:IclR family transcriptional regulator [Bradyrhizobium sp. U87765 SZCCT0131]MBR1261251.1 IclR family transcriptional regulator [Bradyrhizobium sp. U87765 SZCCT0134]MBR1303301.1 IclR family transcriptional regulator [Bradyrhizobium sp. U87765 SZCCT0110]MBR1318907.1 IclR family transcriptional regulator [Bradyrhizobium sp. U87765 SZCCT0109]MBR1347232.1 IclR family transcriptional regulator [Bradyrhizobium sp. U87765 SZCCT0048]
MSVRTDDDDKGAALGVQVIARAASVLRALEGKPDGLSLGEIARAVGLARSTVQRIVAALANEDFVTEAQPGRGVRIGPGLARIAASLSSNFTDILHPHLVALRDEVGETVDLSILSGGSAVFIDQIPGQQRLVAVSGIGERFPLHCTANGKAILSCFAKEDAAALIDKSVTEHADYPIADRSRLLKELDATRRKHLAFDLAEHGIGISAVGTAMVDPFGRPVAVSIPAPTHRFNAEREMLSAALLRFREKLQSIVGR